MAGGLGRYVGEWMMQSLVAMSANLWWSITTFIILPVQATKRLMIKDKPNEFSHILITGASSGIGAELARRYAKQGIKLVLTARRSEKLAAVKKECEDKGAEVKTLSLDVNNKDDMNKQLTGVDKEWPLDLVIANAGIEEATLVRRGKDALELDTQFTVTSTNCLGVVNTLAPVMSRMKNDRKGQLVIMSSVASLAPNSEPGWAAYSASKVWARSYGLGLRGVMAPYGVGVSTICPGFIQTEMVDDVAAMGAMEKKLVEMTVIPVETMVTRTMEAIAYNVPVFFVPWNIGTIFNAIQALNILPPTIRFAFVNKMQE